MIFFKSFESEKSQELFDVIMEFRDKLTEFIKTAKITNRIINCHLSKNWMTIFITKMTHLLRMRTIIVIRNTP